MRELQKAYGHDATDTLVIGDGMTDIGLFESELSSRVGCPANACRGVIERVRTCRGHVAREGFLPGAVEVIAAHASGEVDGDPERGAPTRASRLPVFNAYDKDRRMRIRSVARDAALFGAAVYGAVLALCSVQMLPFGEQVIQAHGRVVASVLRLFGG